MKRTIILTAAALLLTGALPALAGGLGEFLEPGDWRSLLRAQEFGRRADEFTTAPAASEDGGPSDTGRRLKAGGLSLLVPGAGQFYNGERGKGLVMVGVEAVIWGAYLGFDGHADGLHEDARNWAGIYAGTSGDHPDNFWQSVGRYMDSDAWYESQLREARAFDEDAPPPLGADQSWQWLSEDYRTSYQKLRADANAAYDRRDLMILFAILNRAVSVFDAVRNGGAPDADGPSTIGARVLGADVALEVSRPLPDPEARASASWSF